MLRILLKSAVMETDTQIGAFIKVPEIRQVFRAGVSLRLTLVLARLGVCMGEEEKELSWFRSGNKTGLGIFLN